MSHEPVRMLTSIADSEDVQPVADGHHTARRPSEPVLRRMIVPLLGAAMAWAVYWVVGEYASPAGWIHRVLRPSGGAWTQSVPSAITFLFSWTLFDLLGKFRSTFTERRRLRHETLANLPVTLATRGPEEAARSLEELPRSDRKRPVIARLIGLMDLLRQTRDVPRAHEAFRHQADITAEALAGTYTIARVFIWAMPILGFIGTVMGIGLAVGDFSGFLTGDIEDIKLVKSELAKIATGLAYAFDTTLLGLVGSLGAMLLMSFVQKFDEGLQTTVEQLGLGLIASFRDESRAEPMRPTAGQVEGADELLQLLAERLSRLTATLERVQSAADGLGTSLTGVATGEGLLRQAVDAGADAVRQLAHTVERGSASVTQFVDQMTGRLETLSRRQDTSDEAVRAVATLVTRLDDLERLHIEFVKAMDRLHGPFEVRIVPVFERSTAALAAVGGRRG